MAYTEIGRVRPRPLGTHSASQAYEVMDMVMAADGSKAYIATQAVPVGTALTNTAYWAPVVDVSAAVAQADAAADKAGDAADATNGAIASLVDYQAEMLTRVRGETATQSGALVQMAPDAGSLLRVVSKLEPIQSGTGDPSPSNVRPISGRTGVTLKRNGKNILACASHFELYDGATGTFTDNVAVAEWGATDAVRCAGKGGTNAIIGVIRSLGSYEKTEVDQYYTYSMYVRNNSSEKNIIISNNLDASVTITPGTTTRAVMVGYGNGTIVLQMLLRTSTAGDVFDITYWRPQIELGNNATDWQMSARTEYTADFGQTVYGGTLDWTTGRLTVEWGCVTFDGVTDGAKFEASGYASGIYYGVIVVPDPCVSGVGKSSHLKYGGINYGEFYVAGYTLQEIYMYFQDFGTLETANAYLAAQNAAGTPVQIAYKLAAPTVIQLTPQLITALAGTNTVYGDVPSDVTWVKPLATSIEEHIAAALAQSAANAAD